MRISSVSFFVSAFAVLTASAQANLVQNGGFEDPAIVSNTYLQVNAGDTIPGTWLVGHSNIDLVGTNFAETGIVFNAHGGNASVDLTGTGNAGANTISQSIVTTVGQQYTISFYLGRASTTASSAYTGPASLDLSITGSSLLSFTNSNVLNGGIQWTKFTTNFTATSASTTLTFTNTTPAASNYTGLDDVDVSAVPGPAAMLAFGIGSLANLRRRRRG